MENINKIILNPVKHKNPFCVPNGYFEAFANKMDNLIAIEISPKQRFSVVLRSWVAAVALVMLTIGGISYHWHNVQSIENQQDNYETYMMAQIDYNNLMEYYLISERE
jgi:hypothetical protein